MLTLAAASTLAGVGSVASQLTTTVFGDEVSAGADTFKKLYQGQLPNAAATLYTVPASTIALVKSIHCVNNDVAARTAQFFVDGTAAANAITPAVSIPAGGWALYIEDGWKVYDSNGSTVITSAFDATVPTTSQPADVAATGSSVYAARRDQLHGRESFAQTLYDPAVDQALVANATALFRTDPLIVDSGRLVSVPSNSLLWMDAPPVITPTFLNVKDFGAKGDGVTDDTAAINAAINALPLYGGGVAFPSGKFVISSTITWEDRPVWLLGVGSASQPNDGGTQILVAAGVTGFNPQNGALGRGGRGRIEGMRIVGSDAAPGTNDGIYLQANNFQIVNVTCETFGGYGVNIDSTPNDDEHNANNALLQSVRCYSNKTGGMRTNGANANVGTFMNLDLEGNTGYGIYENSFLGNHYFGVHMSTNTVGGIHIGSGGGNSRMYGIYYETVNLPALTMDVGGRGRNVVEFSTAVRPDGTSPIVDNTGAPNFVLLDQNEMHWKHLRVGSDTVGGGLIDIDGTVATPQIGLLLGSLLQLQNAAVTANWTMQAIADGRLQIQSAQAVAVLFSNGIQLPASTATLPALIIASGTKLTNAAAGVIEYDGTAFYDTNDTTNGRRYSDGWNYFRLTGSGTGITTIADFFGANDGIPLVANGVYEIEWICYFSQATAGIATWTIVTATTALANLTGEYIGSPIGGIGAVGTPQTAAINVTASSSTAFPVTGTEATAVTHYFRIRVLLTAGNGASNTRLRLAMSAGTATPLINSYFRVRRLAGANVGTYVA